MPRQLKLQESEAPVDFSTLIITREKLPADLSEAEKATLRANLEHNCDGHTFFFHDRPEVRQALRMRGA